MDNKLEKFPCLVLKYDWNLMSQINLLQPDNPFILSTKVVYQKHELFRIGLKKPYNSSNHQGGYSSVNQLSHATLFLLTANLKKMGLKIISVSYNYKDSTGKDFEKEMDLKTSDINKRDNESDVIQLFTAQFKHGDSFFKQLQVLLLNASYQQQQGRHHQPFHNFNPRQPTTTNLVITFTIHLIGIAENYRVYQIDGLLSQQLQSFVVDQVGTDFKLITKDKKIVNVHKFILAARSSVFATMFIKEPAYLNHEMDCMINEMKQFVKFIYTGELEGLISDGLMQLAVKYKVKSLENLCQVASQSISVNTMASLALHLDPGSIEKTVPSDSRNFNPKVSRREINRELCSVENTSDAELEINYERNVTFFACTWNVLNLWRMKENPETIIKMSVPFELGKERLFLAEFEMSRDKMVENIHNHHQQSIQKTDVSIKMKFLSYVHEKISSNIEEVICSIDQYSPVSQTKQIEMTEMPTLDANLLRVFTLPKIYLISTPSSCLVTFRVKMRSKVDNFISKPIDSTWSEQLWDAAVYKKMTDVEFLVGETTFGAHRSLLSARSPVFAGIFDARMKEDGTRQLRIENVDPMTFKHLLQFIYTGMVEPSSLNGNLFTIAEKFRVDTLMDLCRPSLQTVDMERIISTFFSC